MTQEEFSLYKAIGFFTALIIWTLLQLPLRHHGSWRTDFKNSIYNYILGAVNAVVLSFFVVKLFNILNGAGERAWAVLTYLNLNEAAEITAGVLLLDMATYFWHRASHQLPFLWRFHKVHHSDTNIDASSAVRFHTLEVVLSFAVRVTVVWALGINALTFLIFEIVYQILNLFEHSNMRLPRWLESALAKVFITPALHRKHHSQKPLELNSNFGTIFSCWDILFNTYIPSFSIEVYPLGLPRQSNDWDFKKIILSPFQKSQ